MDKLSKIACYFRWNRGERQHRLVTPWSPRDDEIPPAKESPTIGLDRDLETSTRFFSVLESILLWENSVNSISVVIVFNILFWGIVVLEVRGFAAASSAALVVVLGYSTLEAQVPRENKTPDDTTSSPPAPAPPPTPPTPKVEQINKIVKKAKSTVEALKLLRKNQPGVFCTAACGFSIGLWLIGGAINGVLLTYTICMIILLGPALLLQLPCKIFSPKELCHEYAAEWESEIEEFLPAVTEDNLEVLQRAGDTGEHSPTLRGAMTENTNDPFNEEELVGLKMPSHEDGSTDGLDVSELELSAGDNEVDSMIQIKSEHFEPGSSSDEEADLEPSSKKLPSHSEDDSDSEFEIIDSRDIANFSDV